MKKEKTKNVTLEPIAEADRVPFKEKLAYGIGGLMDGGGVSMMSCVMLAYMTKNGIAMTLASTIMMIAKFWDAITDPFMGFISDNTRGKWGRRKPYMFWGGISLLLCIFLVFLPVREWGMSVGGFTAYIILMYLLWNTCSTVTQVPYCSMASDITPSFRERNNANTVLSLPQSRRDSATCCLSCLSRLSPTPTERDSCLCRNFLRRNSGCA